MAEEKTSIIPVDPSSHDELNALLKPGGEPKVQLVENGSIFKMVKAKKGGGFDLIPVQAEETASEKQARSEHVFASLKGLMSNKD